MQVTKGKAVAEKSIKASRLVIRRGKTDIVKGLDFALEKGSIIGLIGPSGSGKTTLMRAVVGVQKIHSGTLTLFGQPAGARGLRSKLGYVSQDLAVYNDLTVVQNLRYFGALTRTSRARIDEIIVQVDLREQRNQLAETLSGGQRARVSLAIALLGNPELLVLDEPTVGLDPVLRQQLWRLFEALAKEGKTLLVSSHVMTEADKCDTILLMRGGVLLWQNSRAALLSATKTTSVEEAFLALVTEREDG